MICIQEREVQLARNQLADRRFASSHEAHEGQVVDLPVTGHDSVLAQIRGKFKVQTSRLFASQRNIQEEFSK